MHQQGRYLFQHNMAITQNGVLKRDDNDYPVMGGTSSSDNATIINSSFDPVTRRLLTDSASGSGTVTSVSVVTANGFAGSVANPTTTPAITLSTTITGILSGNGTAISAASTTGTGAVVLASSPTLTTPNIGAATATSVNKVTITAPATSAVLTIADGKTLTVSNTLTFTGTDSSSVAFGAGGTVLYSASTIPLTVGSTTISSGTNTRMLYDNSGVLGETTGITTDGTTATLATPVINGLPTGTGVASPPTASTLVARDGNGNVRGVNFIPNLATTATAGGTSTLTVGSSYFRTYTGTQTQTITMPVASTLVVGQGWFIQNQSTGAVTIQSSGGNTIVILASLTSVYIVCQTASGTGTASWTYFYYGDLVASGKSLTVSNTLTFTGTDGSSVAFGAGGTVLYTGSTIPLTVGTTTITSGTSTRILYDNAGVLGEYTLTGSGTVVAMQTAPTFVTSITSPLVIGGSGTTGTQLTLQTTTGNGTTDAMVVKGGNNGGTTFATFTTGALTIGTSGVFTTGTIELGAASDTTLSRSGAGVLAVEGVVIPSISSTNTLTNKRITRRLVTVNVPGATPTTNTDNVDIQNFTGLGTAITSMTTNLSGTPADGDLLEFRFLDDGTARGITWGTSFASTTVTLPTTTVISTTLRVGFEWLASASKWQCIATC